MAQDNDVNLPSGYGGLVRFKEEYASFINFKPTHIVFFLVLLIAFRVGLGFFIKI